MTMLKICPGAPRDEQIDPGQHTLPRLQHLMSLVMAVPIIAIAMTATACLSRPHMHPYSGPSTAESTIAPDDLYAAAVRVFLRRGWGFQQRDAIARAVETDWVLYTRPKFWSQLGVAISYRILVRAGHLEVFTSCKILTTEGNNYKPCSGSERPDGIENAEQELLADVVKEASQIGSATVDSAATQNPLRSQQSQREAGRDPTACISTCGKDRQSCFMSCGRADKCKEGCTDGYSACVKTCDK